MHAHHTDVHKHIIFGTNVANEAAVTSKQKQTKTTSKHRKPAELCVGFYCTTTYGCEERQRE